MSAARYYQPDPVYEYEPEYSAPPVMAWANVQAENLPQRNFRMVNRIAREETPPDAEPVAVPSLSLVPTPDSRAALLLLIEILNPVALFCQHAEKYCTPDDLRRIEKPITSAQNALLKMQKLIR